LSTDRKDDVDGESTDEEDDGWEGRCRQRRWRLVQKSRRQNEQFTIDNNNINRHVNFSGRVKG
jgi:hypothetical protein